METNNLYIWSIKNIKSNRISIHAAQVAFFIMVSFFPFLCQRKEVAKCNETNLWVL